MAREVRMGEVSAARPAQVDSTTMPDALARAVSEVVERVHEAGDSASRIAFLERALGALGSVAAAADSRALQEVHNAPSDVEVLIRILLSPDVLDGLQRDDPLIRARLRGVTTREQILQMEGGTWTAQEVARRLGDDEESVDRLRQDGRLLGIPAGRSGFRYPAWQFDSHGTLPGLATILAAMTVRSPWMRAAFFLSGDVALDGETPLAALQRGDVEAVARAAALYGEQGAA